MADEVVQAGAGASQGTGAAAADGAAQAAAAGAASAGANPSVGAVGQGGAGAAPAVPASPAGSDAGGQAYLSVRDALRNYGYQLPDGLGDDHAALQHVIGRLQQAQQAEQLARLGQEYQRYQPQFMQWYAQQQQAAQQQQQKQQKWFNAPEYDPRWTQMLTRDDKGQLVPAPGAPPDILQKFTAWNDHFKGFLEKFAQDPIAAIKPGLEQVVQEMAGRLTQQSLGQYQERLAAQQLIQQNLGWMARTDAQGQPVYDQQGRPVLSEWGQRYLHYVNQCEQRGIQGTQAQHEIAYGLTERDFYASRQQQAQQQQTAQQAGEQQKQQFLQQAGQGGAAAAAPQAAGSGNTNGAAVPGAGKGLFGRMLAAFAANGHAPDAVLR